jgi:two-component system sensor histidine kinase AtoS
MTNPQTGSDARRTQTVSSLVRQYVIVFVSIAVAVWLRTLLDPLLGDHLPFVTFFVAVMVASWFGGIGASVVALLLGFVAATYFFVPPRHTFAITSVPNVIGLFLYFFVGISSLVLIQAHKAARGRAEHSEEALRRLNLDLEERVRDRTAQLEGQIAERKRAEATVLEAEAKFRILVEQSLLGVYILGRDGKLMYANPKVVETLGYSQDELLTIPVIELVAEGDREMVADSIRKRLSGEVPHVHYECRCRRKDGRLVTLEVYGARTDLNGVPTIIGMFQDVTEHKAMEQQAQRLERLASLGQLVSGLAHELKNPLFILTGHLQLMQERLRSGQVESLADDLEQTRAAAGRMSQVASRFLQFSKPAEAHREPCSVKTILQRTLDFVANEMMQHQIKVVTHLEQDQPDILTDQDQLQGVFLNLVINAMQAMSQAHGGGTLTVSASRSGEWVEVRVQDDGPGISPEYHAKLFEPFFSTKSSEQATGLGLWIVRSTLMTLNGSIRFETEIGRGTTFIVSLPVAST